MAGKDPLHEEQLDQEAEVRGELEERLQAEQDEKWDGVEDWTTERETEIQRLEQENALLRNALGISVERERELGLEDAEVTEQAATHWPPFGDPFSSPSRAGSFKDDRGRGNGRLAIGPLGGAGPQRRSGPPVPGRRALYGFAERVASPPNDVRWEPNDIHREPNDMRKEQSDTRKDPNEMRREQNGIRWEPVVESI